MTFLECLFNSNEATCFSQTPKGTTVFPIHEPESIYAYFSINPLQLDKDNQPTESWHLESKGRRADCNVTSYRNILIEMDKMDISKQEQHMQDIGAPYSTAVYSGSKSVHFIISLETPIDTAKEYRRLVSRVFKAVGEQHVDVANKNPSRLSRLPGHIRIDTGKEQKLLEVRGQVPNAVLESWLVSRGAEDSVWEEVSTYNRPKNAAFLSPSTKLFLMDGAQEGKWNLTLFKASADFCRVGYSLEEAYAAFLKITGILTVTDEKTIHSAYRNQESSK